jgi:hypothetical protein
MNREINLQKLKVLFVYALMVGVIAYEWHFVKSGIVALPVLNSTIIVAFLIGNIIVWKSLFALNNETAVLRLIAESYKDTHSGVVDDDVLATRRQRCLQKGTVLRRPALLGPAFDILMDEFWRGRSLRFRLDTVQMLLATVEHKMARERGLVGYVSGLAIFLGLIGTFVGLMEMVHSVGGIIGSLAGANASPESIQNLIKALQAPLTGMAQGFSASLFGLFASLVLSLIGRFANSANYSVKEQFESWLTSVSQLEQTRLTEGGSRGEANSSSAILAQRAAIPDPVAPALARAADAQMAQARELERLAERFEAVAINHGALHEVLRRTDIMADEMKRLRQTLSQDQANLFAFTEDGLSSLRQIAGEQKSETGALQGQIEALRASFDARFDASERRFGEMTDAQRHAYAQFDARMEDAARARDAFAADMVGRQADLVAGLRRMEAHMAMAPDPTLIGSSLRGILVEGFADVAQRLEDATRAAVQTAATTRSSADDSSAITEIREMTRMLESSLTHGLSDVAQSFRHTLDLYAGMMRQAQDTQKGHADVRARDAG